MSCPPSRARAWCSRFRPATRSLSTSAGRQLSGRQSLRDCGGERRRQWHMSSFSSVSAKVLDRAGPEHHEHGAGLSVRHDGVPNDYASATGTSMARRTWRSERAGPPGRCSRPATRRSTRHYLQTSSRARPTRSTIPLTNANYSRINLGGRSIRSKQLAAGLGERRLSAIDRPQATGDTSYAVTATHTGIFTAEAIFNNAAGRRRHRSSRCQQQYCSQQRDRVEQRTGRCKRHPDSSCFVRRTRHEQQRDVPLHEPGSTAAAP